MVKPAATVTTLAFAPLLRVAAAGGDVAVAAVRHAAGTWDGVASLERHVDVERWYAAWEALADALPDVPVVVQAAQRASLSDLEVFGFLALTAAGLADAFASVGKVRALWARGSGWHMAVNADGTVSVRLEPWQAPDRPGARLAHTYLLADMVQSIRDIGGDPIEPIEVRLRHSMPTPPAPLQSFFGESTRLREEAGEDAVVFGPAIGALKVRAFDTRLHGYFRQQCDALVARAVDDDAWLTKARRWIAEQYPHAVPTAAALARALGTSERSLRRRFVEEGTSYRALHDGVAVELANAFLQRPGLTASEVAFLLGFSEPSAFFRAYARWTGETPRAFQARARSAAT